MRAPIDFETEAFDTFHEFETPDRVGNITSSWVQQAAIRSALRAGNEAVAVRFAIAAGVRDENKLTDLVFYTRFPQQQGRKLTRGDPFIQKWLDIRDTIVRPALRTAASPSTSAASPPTGPAATNKQAGVIFGLDAASVDDNKNPDWAKARTAGPIGFAIIRASFGVWDDSVFKHDWPKLKNAGIVRGAYLFLRFPPPIQKYHEKKVPDPASQAEAFCKTVGNLDESDLPPSLDVEFPGGRRVTSMTSRQLLDGVRAAWKVLKDRYRGAAPIMYTSARVWAEDLDNLSAPDLVESPLWLAKPWPYRAHHPAVLNAGIFAGGRLDPKVPPSWGPGNWWIHQYQGDADARALPGFRQVDMDRFNTMQLGETGNRVRWVQRRLGIAQNGQFDAAMDSAVRAFQSRKGLVSNGIIDPRTFAYLCWSNP